MGLGELGGRAGGTQVAVGGDLGGRFDCFLGWGGPHGSPSYTVRAEQGESMRDRGWWRGPGSGESEGWMDG